MSEARTFLDTFKVTRDFKSAFPLLLENEEFRKGIFSEIDSIDYPYPEYASWIAIHFFEKHPSLLTHWIPLFKAVLLRTSNHTVQRNLVNVLLTAQDDLSSDAELLNLLIAFAAGSDSLPALKISAFKLTEQQFLPAFPDLVYELKALTELYSEDQRPSIQALCRNFNKRHQQLLSH